MKKLRNFIILILFILVSFQGLAQEKIERETGVKKEKVPAAAIEFMEDAFEGARKIKWYYEETSGKQSYEAKLKWDGRMNSLEFNTKGLIEDIEKEYDFKELDPPIQKRLENWFSSNFLKYKIRKTQQQWTGTPDDLEDAVDENEMDDITIRYEIEFFGSTEEERSLWEGLFDARGNFIEKKKIILRPTDNLNF